MGGSTSFGGSGSHSRNRQASWQATRFPSEFLDPYSRIFGAPFTMQEITSLAPRTTSLFGGGSPTGGMSASFAPAAPQPGDPRPPAPSATASTNPAAPVTDGRMSGDQLRSQRRGGTTGGLSGSMQQPPPQAAPPAAQQAAPAATGAAYNALPAQQSPAEPRRYTIGDVTAYLHQSGKTGVSPMRLMQAAREAGIDITNGFTLQELGTVIPRIDGATRGMMIEAYGALQGQENLANQTQANRFAPGAPTQGLSGDFINQGIANTGLGAAPREYTAPGSVLNGVNPVTGPNVNAAQVNLPGGSPEAYQQAVYESLYRPQERAIEQQREVQGRGLSSALAGAGLVASGAGFGQRQRQEQEFNRELNAASGDAAARASAARFEAERGTLEANAAREQETRLTRAQLDQRAQEVTAGNILQGNMQNADNYLRTLGLNEQTAQAARQDFLGLMNIAQEDLARMDRQQLAQVDQMFNAYLRQMGIIAGSGDFGSSAGSSTSNSIAVNGSISGGAGGGGGSGTGGAS